MQIEWSLKSQFQRKESLIFFSQHDNLHHPRIAIMTSRKAEHALFKWNPVNQRIMAHFTQNTLRSQSFGYMGPQMRQVMKTRIQVLQTAAITDSIHKHDQLIVMPDLNAKVGEVNESCKSIMGKHGVRVTKENTDKLLEFSSLNNLVITGTIFPHQIHKLTWVFPGVRNC